VSQNPRILCVGAPPEIPWHIEVAGSPEEAGRRMAVHRYTAVIACGQQGLSLDDTIIALRSWLDPDPVPVLAYDAEASPRTAARYIRLGAEDVAGRDDSLVEMIQAALERLPAVCPKRTDHGWRDGLVGESPAMRRAAEVLQLAAPRRSTVLITGETGTGKELFARALHLASPRAHAPMIIVNAAALPENLLEAELFGHVKGAFTGAVQQRTGRFEQAHRSTLFLDEIGDLPLAAQTKLLRFLQEREFQRVGSSETIKVDVRMVAATNVDLEQRMREGKFREDLFYRLNVIPVFAPPLRERIEDIPSLASYLLEKICRFEEIPLKRITEEACSRLRAHLWPGNVRQLENALETAVALSGNRDLLHVSDFARLLGTVPRVVPPGRSGEVAIPESGLDFEGTVGAMERRILEQALLKTGGNKSAAAEMLGLKRTTLAAKLRSLGAAAGS
jgi:DNA-binding NtrC family response regulator